MDIKTELMELPEIIKQQEYAVADLAREIEKRQSAMEFLRINVSAAVASEREDGKNRFPNETLREAEVIRRLQSDPEKMYPDWERMLRTDKTNLEAAQIELRYELNMFSALKTIAQMREG